MKGTSRSQIAPVSQELSQGGLNDNGQRGARFLVTCIAFKGVGQIVRNGYGCAFHLNA
jgi:hypothetical protein